MRICLLTWAVCSSLLFLTANGAKLCLGQEQVRCIVDPCRFADCPAYPAAVCESNYCGECNAEFYLNGIQLLDVECRGGNLASSRQSPPLVKSSSKNDKISVMRTDPISQINDNIIHGGNGISQDLLSLDLAADRISHATLPRAFKDDTEQEESPPGGSQRQQMPRGQVPNQRGGRFSRPRPSFPPQGSRQPSRPSRRPQPPPTSNRMRQSRRSWARKFFRRFFG